MVSVASGPCRRAASTFQGPPCRWRSHCPYLRRRCCLSLPVKEEVASATQLREGLASRSPELMDMKELTVEVVRHRNTVPSGRVRRGARQAVSKHWLNPSLWKVSPALLPRGRVIFSATMLQFVDEPLVAKIVPQMRQSESTRDQIIDIHVPYTTFVR